MPRHHYVPASAIGMFSMATARRPRERTIACARRGVSKPWITKAERILAEDNLYQSFSLYPLDPPEDDTTPGLVDDSWTNYEHRLVPALQALERWEPLSASTWLEVLVPYVASVFVRGREWTDRFNGRLGNTSNFFTPAEAALNANFVRLMELQRLRAPVCAASWRVFHAQPGSYYIANDLWASPNFYATLGERTLYGWGIPISHSALLSIIPLPGREILSADDNGRWVPIIEHWGHGASGVEAHNRQVAGSCHDLVLGPNLETVARYHPDTIPASAVNMIPDPEANMMDAWHQIPGRNLREHEHDWRELCAIAGHPAKSTPPPNTKWITVTEDSVTLDLRVDP